MKVESIQVGYLKENCYVVSDELKRAIIIDPGDEFERIQKLVKPYQVVGVLVTHAHADHIGALASVESTYHVHKNDLVNGFHYQVYPTPGHTSDSISFYFKEIHSLFVGDFVFKDDIGRTDIGGNEKEMLSSIAYLLKTFSDDTILYPGHGEETTLGEERKRLEEYLQ